MMLESSRPVPVPYAFSGRETYKFVITFTEVEEDAYKIKVEELFEGGRRVDLIHRPIEIFGFPSIIERTDLHLTREAAQELWQMVQTSKEDFMLHSRVNSAGQRFVEYVQHSKIITFKAIDHLSNIAESLHAQRKRQAAKAEKELAAAAKAAKAAAAKAARAAKKSKKRSSSSSGSKGSKGSKGSRRS